jgi:hypothetical protein
MNGGLILFPSFCSSGTELRLRRCCSVLFVHQDAKKGGRPFEALAGR